MCCSFYLRRATMGVWFLMRLAQYRYLCACVAEQYYESNVTAIAVVEQEQWICIVVNIHGGVELR